MSRLADEEFAEPGGGYTVGINTAIIPMARSIGFAIPVGAAGWMVPRLMAYGRVRRGYPGIYGQTRPLHLRMFRFFHLDREQAVEVVSITILHHGDQLRLSLTPEER